MTRRLWLDLGDRSYDILIGPGLIGEAGGLIAPLLAQPRVFIVSDTNVAPLYLAPLAASLAKAGIAVQSHVMPAGEGSKDFQHLEPLIDTLLAAKVERSTTLIALGGGVVGDLAGFAAAICLRGMPFIQVPTTLLAQVDSSVGGKTGINAKLGKNLVGAFYQPKLVLADTAALSTLPRRELLSGYAEVAKYGLIDDEPFFAWLESHAPKLLSLDPDSLGQAIETCCRAKARIVGADEREAGQRALLNLGHTFGHALEAETGYGDRLLHGEAVAAGMALAFDLSCRMGLCSKEDAQRVRRHLEASGLPAGLPRIQGIAWKSGRLIEHMGQDKKMQDGRVTFVLAKGVGKAFLERNVSQSALAALLDEAAHG
jgi:3-dehydroquinate synthase